MENNNKRERGSSFNNQDPEVSLEELTIMKLMEEIMEFDMEIKMKQSWINTRMKLLHKLMPKQENNNIKKLI